MVNRIHLTGIDEFHKYAEEIGPNGKDKPVVFLFTGEKTASGESWCIDCRKAEPVIESYLTEVKTDFVFVTVDVGNMQYWKNKECPFRTDNRLRLMVIPTMIRWKGVQRLEGEQCGKRDLLQMLVEEDED